MNTSEIMGTFDKYVIPNYTRMPIAIVRGEGSRIWDTEGRSYLDLFPGWGVNGIGHCHPRVVGAIREQAARLLHVANHFYMEPQGRLAQLISERSFGGQCFFCNSGAEACDGAVKLARLTTGGDKYTVITMENSFHGRTFCGLSATGQEKYHQGLGPLLPGFRHAPFNDLAAVEAAVDDTTCAVMTEPVQGEGGVNIATPEFLGGLRRLCDERGLLLIFDEVQTGVGRTGKWFGYQHTGVEPDIMIMAKALGGGAAIGAIEARPEAAKYLVPGTHAATFGGNPLACAAGVATFEAIEEEGLLDNARRAGALIEEHFKRFADEFPFVTEVRVLGCMAGLQLARSGAGIVKRCLDKGMLINCTHDTVLRMLPAMTITAAEIEEGMDILHRALREEQ